VGKREKEGGKEPQRWGRKGILPLGAVSWKAEGLCPWCTLSQPNSPGINNSSGESADSHHPASLL